MLTGSNQPFETVKSCWMAQQLDLVPRTFNPRLTEKGFQAGGEGEAFAATKWRKQDGNLESIHQGEYSRFAI